MPPKDSAAEMIYKILENMSGVSIGYDAKTNTIYTTDLKTATYEKNAAADNCYVSCATDHKCSQCENWKEKEEEVKMKNNAKPAPVYSPFAVRSVLSNRKKNAFSVVWMDGTTTVVHCQAGDDWDDEKALAMCFTKKALGNKGNFNDKFNDALDNKMKVIPAEPAPEKACNCDSACEKCKCKEEAKYDVYLHFAEKNKSKELLVKGVDIHYIRHFLRTFIHDNDYGPYYRVWNCGDGVFIDYGSYSSYLYIPGLKASDLAHK